MHNSNIIPVISANLKHRRIPARILAIRLQAMGDLVITLPYLQSLRQQLPASTEIHLLTRKEVDPIPRALQLFHEVYSIGGERNRYKQWLSAGWLLPRLLLNRYDTVIDLQNNEISRFVRKMVHPVNWSEFDRFSPLPAGERTKHTIEAAGFEGIGICSEFKLKSQPQAESLLRANGWRGGMLVVLNPAGAFETRHWPMENYCEFARLWGAQFPGSQFLIMGTSFIARKAAQLKKVMQDNLINLVGQTTAATAFEIIRHASLVVSEDSGLMHMAWVSGVPVLALFGSTKSDWSRPLGEKSILLGSSDLPCGECLQETCQFGDVHCLTRYSPEMVFEKAITLVHNRPELSVS